MVMTETNSCRKCGAPLTVDASGNVFVTGSSTDSGGDPDSATIAYSGAGVPLWTNRYNGLNNKDYAIENASGIAVDRSGNVFVTGTSYDGTNAFCTTLKYSSSVPPPRLDCQKQNNEPVLSWTNAGFNLQSAPGFTGPFTNLPAATRPVR